MQKLTAAHSFFNKEKGIERLTATDLHRNAGMVSRRRTCAALYARYYFTAAQSDIRKDKEDVYIKAFYA